MKSYRFFLIIVIVLVIINCISLGLFWYKQDNRLGRGGPPGAVYEYLSKELKLTAGQQKLYEVMCIKHFEYTRKLNEQSRMLRDSFFEQIKTPVLDTAIANAFERKISTIQISLDTATLNHFRKFRTILNAEQQDKFDHIIKNALHMMGGPPPHRRGDRPGPRNDMPPPPNGGPEHGPPGGPPPPDN